MNRTGDESGIACVRLLREAETRGRQLITAARNRKTKRVKDARIQAEAEINQFKDKCERRLRENHDILESEEALRGAEINENIKFELKNMEERVQACSSEVIELLERLVCHINPDVHHNLHIRQQIEAGHDSHINLHYDPIVDEMVNKCLSNCELIAAGLPSDKNNNSSSDA